MLKRRELKGITFMTRLTQRNNVHNSNRFLTAGGGSFSTSSYHAPAVCTQLLLHDPMVTPTNISVRTSTNSSNNIKTKQSIHISDASQK